MLNLDREPYINLATFRRNGIAVETPVWVAVHDGRAFVFSAGNAGKVKRLRHTAAVRIAPCDVRGKVSGDWVEGEATLVSGDVDAAPIYRAFTRKYGLQMRIADFFSRLSGRYNKRTLIEIKPGA